MGRCGYLLGGAAALAVLAGCGASSHKSAATTSSVVTTAPATSSAPEPAITHRLLRTSEMPAGFTAQGDPSVSSTIAQWLQASQESGDQLKRDTARLKRIGFVAGANLSLNSAQGDGVSVVEQFRSPAGARSELATSLATFDGGPAARVNFSVPGVPSSGGWSGHGAGGGVNVAFAAGDYYYLVGEQPNAVANRAAVIKSAQELYHRVHG